MIYSLVAFLILFYLGGNKHDSSFHFHEKSKDRPVRLNFLNRNGKSNNYDLITRVKVTDTAPASPQDVVAIHDNPPLTEDYKKAIYEWSKDSNKRGINNWVAVQIIWDALNNTG